MRELTYHFQLVKDGETKSELSLCIKMPVQHPAFEVLKDGITFVHSYYFREDDIEVLNRSKIFKWNVNGKRLSVTCSRSVSKIMVYVRPGECYLDGYDNVTFQFIV